MTIYPVKQNDLLNALIYASQSLNFTYNRMSYTGNESQRFQKIRAGIVIENIVFKILNNEYDLPFISEPIKTDYRTNDTSEVLLKTECNKLLNVDIKGFHIFQTYNNSIRTPEIVYDKGWALVPKDQFKNQKKDIYIFPFLIADEEENNFLHNNDVCICTQNNCDCQKQYIEDNFKKQSIEEYDDELHIILSYLRNNSLISKVIKSKYPYYKINEDIQQIDAVSSFTNLVCNRNIYLIANNHTFFIDKNKWIKGEYSLKNASIFIAGWATKDDVSKWSIIPKGTNAYPYFKTRNENIGIKCNQLRPMEELIDYIKCKP